MDVKIEESWKKRLADEFEKDYFKQLTDFVKQEYRQGTVYPPGPYMFNAFEHCPFDKVKVVILGQDPYHEPGQAHGLCFSVQDGVPFPPSLINIFKEIQDDLGHPVPTTGNLIRWADQGVLLLNATLTVRAHQAGSHQIEVGRPLPMLLFIVWRLKEAISFTYYGVPTHKRKVLSSIHPVTWFLNQPIRLHFPLTGDSSETSISAKPMII